jgi:hypothetical protein
MRVYALDSTHLFCISTIVHGMHLLQTIVKSMAICMKILVTLQALHVVFAEEEQQVLDQQAQHSVQLIPTTLEMGKKFVKVMALM